MFMRILPHAETNWVPKSIKINAGWPYLVANLVYAWTTAGVEYDCMTYPVTLHVTTHLKMMHQIFTVER